MSTSIPSAYVKMAIITETEDADVGRAPICPYCGVTALPAEGREDSFVCENPDCDAFGEPVAT